MSTFRELLKKGTEKLVKAGVPDAGSDAWMLMEFAFEIEKGYYFLHEDDKIEKEQQERYEKLIAEREKSPTLVFPGTNTTSLFCPA